MEKNETARKRLQRGRVKGALILAFTLILAVNARSQKNADFELSAVNGVGIGGLNRRIDRAIWGGSFYGGWRLRGTPFMLGARLEMTNYGSEHNVDLAGFSDLVPAGVKYNYNLLLTHLVLRYQPRMSSLTPYLEASVGLSYYFTQVYSGGVTTVPFIVGDTVMTIAGSGSETLMSSLAPSFGLGGGLKVRLARIGREGQSGRSPFSVFLNLQGRYSYSGTARYLEPGSLALEGGRLIKEPQRSSANTFFFSLGLSVGGNFQSR